MADLSNKLVLAVSFFHVPVLIIFHSFYLLMREYLIYLRAVNDGVLCWATDWVQEHYGRSGQNRADFGGIAPPTYRCHMGREHQTAFHSVAEWLPSFS